MISGHITVVVVVNVVVRTMLSPNVVIASPFACKNCTTNVTDKPPAMFLPLVIIELLLCAKTCLTLVAFIFLHVNSLDVIRASFVRPCRVVTIITFEM